MQLRSRQNRFVAVVLMQAAVCIQLELSGNNVHPRRGQPVQSRATTWYSDHLYW